MGDLTNPYANPYLPSFVNQRPRTGDMTPSGSMPQMNYPGVNFGQIHSVRGFEGARAYNLANGASEILAEEDPNLARIYIVAKDTNGQSFVQGFDLIPVEEPKPVTMDDLNTKMNQLLERLNKLEEENANGNQPVPGNGWKNSGKSASTGNQSNGRRGQNGSESASSDRTDGPR